MLKIFNELAPFFEDVYREVSVREYAKITKVSPPTASTVLKKYEKEGILLLEKKGIYYYFRASRNSLFVDLSRIYWKLVLRPFVSYILPQAKYGKIILFGSASKAENTVKSDLDIYIEVPIKQINVAEYEKKLKRRIELHFMEETRNENLRRNIYKGVFLNQ